MGYPIECKIKRFVIIFEIQIIKILMGCLIRFIEYEDFSMKLRILR